MVGVSRRLHPPRTGDQAMTIDITFLIVALFCGAIILKWQLEEPKP